LLWQLPGQFRSLEAHQEVDITRRAANLGFLDALRLVRTAKLRPLRLQLRQRLLFIRDASRRDRASRAGRTLRRGGLNQTERQNKAKCETLPHARLRRFETLLETVSLTCSGAYAKSARSRLARRFLPHRNIRRSRRLSKHY
jgi:hypothetical protein